ASRRPSCGGSENKLARRTCKQCASPRQSGSAQLLLVRIQARACNTRNCESFRCATQCWANLSATSFAVRQVLSSRDIGFQPQAEFFPALRDCNAATGATSAGSECQQAFRLSELAERRSDFPERGWNGRWCRGWPSLLMLQLTK